MYGQRFQFRLLSVTMLFLVMAAPATERNDRCSPIAAQEPVSQTRDEFLAEVRETFQLTAPSREGGTVIVAERDPITEFNGLLVSSWPNRYVSQLIYEGLATLSPIDGTPAPQLADSWEVSPDGRTYTFRLSKEATWHDGVDFTAQDVTFSYDAVKSGQIPNGSLPALDDLTFRAVDDDTFEITVDTPTVTFLWSVPAAIPILPKHLWESVDPADWDGDPGSTGADPERVIGTGPFLFQEHNPADDSVTLAANADHYSTPPALDTVVVRNVEDEDRLPLLQSDEIVMAEGIAEAWVEDDINQGTLNQRLFPAIRMTYFTYYTVRPPLDDVLVRQALYIGLDRDKIIKDINFGFGSVPTGTHPRMSIAYAPDAIQDPYEFDLERARALLEEAGWSDSDRDGDVEKDGRPLQLDIVGSEGMRSLMEALEQQWRELGVSTHISDDPWDNVEAKAQGENYEFDIYVGNARLRCHADEADFFGSEGSRNYTGWSDERYEALQQQQLGEFDVAKRRDLLVQQSNIAWNELPIGILRFFDITIVWSAEINNFNPNDLGGTYWSLPFVWIDESG